jgi:hypothetical protein
MNSKITLILALIFVIGVVSVVVLNKQDKKQEEQKKQEESLLTVAKDSIDEIFLEPSGIHAVKEGDEWKIVAPVVTDGDKSAIDAIANMFDWAKMERTISSDVGEYAEFGLAPERGRMILVHDESTDTLYLGDKSPTGSFVFARKSGSPDVFLTSTSLQTNIEKKLFDLRNKDVLGFEKNDINTFSLELKKATFELQKSAGKWRLVKPLDSEADETEVDKILNRLDSEKAKEFVEEDPADLKKFGLTSPTVRVELLLGENKAQKILLIGKLDNDKYYAKDESRKPVFLVDSAFVGILNTTLFDLRNKKLADFNSSDIDRFELEYADSTIMCEKDTADNWLMVSPAPNKLKSWKISSLTSGAANLKVEEFVTDKPGSLKSYGLDNPAIKARFYKGEKNLLELFVGNVKGERVYAKTNTSDSVYLVGDDIIQKLRPNWKDIIEETESEGSTDQ